jgi:hypothetical protein
LAKAIVKFFSTLTAPGVLGNSSPADRDRPLCLPCRRPGIGARMERVHYLIFKILYAALAAFHILAPCLQAEAAELKIT